jgi:hypothetical protein
VELIAALVVFTPQKGANDGSPQIGDPKLETTVPGITGGDNWVATETGNP